MRQRSGGEVRQKILVFRPHPDDDVISMGGTLITLADQGHDVHVAYMTSANIAVFNHDAMWHIDFVNGSLETFGLESDSSVALKRLLLNITVSRQPGVSNCEELLAVKALIRRTEANAAAQVAGVSAENLHFLDFPFYRTRQVSKHPVGKDDVEIIAKLLRSRNPDQIYVAGDLSDPHGTHRMCAQAIIHALEIVESKDVRLEVCLYRGAWQEYEPHEIERAMPLSPELMLRKKLAIFKHKSQKDRALFPGHDQREFLGPRRTAGKAYGPSIQPA